MIAGEANPVVSAGVMGLADLHAARAVSPVETLEIFLARIGRLNGGLNAVADLDEAGARAAAEASAARWRAGEPLGPLDGAPILVKANLAVKGLPWTAALSAYREAIAQDDAAVVARLRQAGAVILGTATMHEAAFGATNDSPLYGPAFNPFGEGLTPGGSSGASAAAVAAGLCAAALGTDTLGSVRLPAAYCGGVGFKPSFGRLPRTGLRLLSYSLDTVGFHTRRAADLDALLAACEGLDANDPWSCATPSSTPWRGLRLGVADVSGVSLDPAVADAFERGLARLRAMGADLAPARLGIDIGAARIAGLILCEAEGAALFEDLLADPASGLSPLLRQLLEYGARLPAPRLAKAQMAVMEARRSIAHALDGFDALVLPTAPHRAFRQGDAPPASQADLTALANLAGAPAVSTPLPMPDGERPAGLQILCPFGADARAIAIAAAFEETP